MEIQFAKELVNEYDELQRFITQLEDNSNSIGVIHSFNDNNTCINYTTYSDKYKELILSALKFRLEVIKTYFN